MIHFRNSDGVIAGRTYNPAGMKKTWLEVALNGSWGKARQPGIPVRIADIVAQGIACASEGAAVVHVHAYDEATGQQDDRDGPQRRARGDQEQDHDLVFDRLASSGSVASRR